MKRIGIFLIVIVLIRVSTIFAGWTIPVRISDGPSYQGILAYGNGILHALYVSLPHDTLYYLRSTDLGQNWSTPIGLDDTVLYYPQIRASGDSVAAIWSLFSGYVAFRKSINGGLNWSSTHSLLTGNINDFDFCLSGPKIFLGYITDSLSFKKSTDFGTGWSTPVTVYSSDGLQQLKMGCFGNNIFITANGRPDSRNQYEVFFFKSTDAGQTWSSPVIISRDDSVTSYMPVQAVNERGDVAVCWASEHAGGPLISLRISHDLGISWGRILSSELPGWVGFDMNYAGDTLHLVSGNKHEVSINDGVTWAPIDTFERDIYASSMPVLAVTPGMVHVVWSSSRSHNSGIYYSRWEAGYAPPDTLPPDLIFIGKCQSHYGGVGSNITVSGNYAYCGSEIAPNLVTIDIYNPYSPNVICAFDPSYSVTG